MGNKGVIYWVGTGPGDVSLITARGLALVREADALVGDTVACARLLQEARPEAERYDTGSRQRSGRLSQAEVSQLLLGLAGQGKTVVRLWPGDPFIYGHQAIEEIRQVRQAGLGVQVVPGVTSASAAPAYAGVPLTHWDYASSFAVVAGFQPDNAAARPNWTALAGVETLVILMPLENLAGIVARLLEAGRPAETPVMAIQDGTLPQQKSVRATLGTLAETVRAAALGEPILIVVGEIVRLADELAWFEPGEGYPLLGQRVLVTRPAHQAADLLAALRALGAEPVSFPTIEIRPVEDTGPLDGAIQRINATTRRRMGPGTAPIGREAAGHALTEPPYDWLVLTSANGVAAFWERLQSADLDSRCLASVRVAAIGPATAEALAARSILPDLVPEVYTAEGVLEAFDRLGPVTGQRFLLARADIARKTLAEGLAAREAQVDEIASYRTVPVSQGGPPPAADIVTFTSSSTVQGYVNCLGGRSPAEVLKQSQVVCIGPVTAATARELAVPVSAVAEAYTVKGLLETLVQLVESKG